MPRVFNKNLDKIPADAVYVGRGSPWGNPFVIGPDGSRDDVCNKYQLMVEKNPKLKARIKSQLAGKNLVCFCKPARCHGDYLLAVANEENAK